MNYTVRRSVTGKYFIKYTCKCNVELESEYTQAGKATTCPTCNGRHVVPGLDAVPKIQQDIDKRKKAAESKAREREKAAEQKAQERALANLARVEAKAKAQSEKAKADADRKKVLAQEAARRQLVVMRPQAQQPITQDTPQFRCPYCQSAAPPIRCRKTSTGGWIFFWVLLLFLCFPICWIGLLIKDDYVRCASCGIKLG